MINRWIQTAKEIGFHEACPLDPATLKAMPQIRDMCAADKCHAYGKNWTCPPLCGTIEECQAQMSRCSSGILIQTVGQLKRRIDSRTIFATEKIHLEMFHKLSDLVHQEIPDALCLGAGGCRICSECAWPDPCRFPDRACSSMEGYGLFVTQVCKDNALPYYHGEKTITYTACILFP